MSAAPGAHVPAGLLPTVTVYVDDMYAKFGRMKMCHMIADTSEELFAMADKIGLNRKWLQHPGGPDEHFDVSMLLRERAVVNGAQEITWRELGTMTMARRRLAAAR